MRADVGTAVFDDGPHAAGDSTASALRVAVLAVGPVAPEIPLAERWVAMSGLGVVFQVLSVGVRAENAAHKAGKSSHACQ